MKEINIIKANLEDIDTIVQISKETFFETFAKDHSQQAVLDYIEMNLNVEQINNEIGNSESLFFIAWNDGSPAGYLKLNSGNAQTEIKNENSLEVQRIYVKSGYQGKKIGQLLFDKSVEIARQQKRDFIWLGVWEENVKAISFYKQNGFNIFDKHIFLMGNNAQTDLMMKKLL